MRLRSADNAGVARRQVSVADRRGLVLVGPIALVGMLAGAYLSIWVADAVFDPGERNSQSSTLYYLDNLFEFLVVWVPILFGATLVGWLGLPAVIGRALGWTRIGLGLGLQLTIGALLALPLIWLTNWLGNLTTSAYLMWGPVLISLLCVPVVARLLALRGSQWSKPNH